MRGDGAFGFDFQIAGAVIARSEANEAIHSFFPRRDGLLRGACHRARVRATRWLAMTIQNAVPRSRGAMRPSCTEIIRPNKKRAQGMPGARCTRGLVCKMHKEMRTRAYRVSGDTPAFPAQWLYGLCRALRGGKFVLSPSSAD